MDGWMERWSELGGSSAEGGCALRGLAAELGVGVTGRSLQPGGKWWTSSAWV